MLLILSNLAQAGHPDFWNLEVTPCGTEEHHLGPQYADSRLPRMHRSEEYTYDARRRLIFMRSYNHAGAPLLTRTYTYGSAGTLDRIDTSGDSSWSRVIHYQDDRESRVEHDYASDGVVDAVEVHSYEGGVRTQSVTKAASVARIRMVDRVRTIRYDSGQNPVEILEDVGMVAGQKQPLDGRPDTRITLEYTGGKLTRERYFDANGDGWSIFYVKSLVYDDAGRLSMITTDLGDDGVSDYRLVLRYRCD